EMKTDRLSSAILDFPQGQSVFTCSTQLCAYQRMHFVGTKGRVEVQIPFNAPNDAECKVFVDDGSCLHGSGIETISHDICDQYTIQGDEFSKAILEDRKVPVPLEDAIKNMAVIEAVFRSAETGNWETPAS
ncbi:MAG: Gfo/Idh/MocA family oxidoreductase, partial [Planctomycetota bacterium]